MKMLLHSLIWLLLVMTVVLVEQDVELGQLCQALEQLREEKAKEIGRANKLAEELNGEYSLDGVTAEVTFLLDGTLYCLQTTIGGSRHSLMCWSRTPGPRGTNLTP